MRFHSFDHALPLARELIVDHAFPNGPGHRLREDVYEWLCEFVGGGSRQSGWIEGCEWVWSYAYKLSSGPVENVMSFKDPRKATLFKLRWG